MTDSTDEDRDGCGKMGKLRLALVAWWRSHMKRNMKIIRKGKDHVSLKAVTRCFNSIQWEKERLLENFKGAWYQRARSETFLNEEKSNAICVWNYWVCNVTYIPHRTDIKITWYLQLEDTAFIANTLILVDFLWKTALSHSDFSVQPQ